MLTDLAFRSKQSNGYDDAFMALCQDELTISGYWIERSPFWVALNSEDEIVGMVGVNIESNGRSAEIMNFFIEPAHKRRGIGQRLWQAVKDHAKAQDIKSLCLDADPHAVPFYESIGFMVEKSVPSGSIPGRELPHMVLFL